VWITETCFKTLVVVGWTTRPMGYWHRAHSPFCHRVMALISLIVIVPWRLFYFSSSAPGRLFPFRHCPRVLGSWTLSSSFPGAYFAFADSPFVVVSGRLFPFRRRPWVLGSWMLIPLSLSFCKGYVSSAGYISRPAPICHSLAYFHSIYIYFRLSRV
jgi:hypothetical protein